MIYGLSEWQVGVLHLVDLPVKKKGDFRLFCWFTRGYVQFLLVVTGTCILIMFPETVENGIIIPPDELIFVRWVETTTKQKWSGVFFLWSINKSKICGMDSSQQICGNSNGTESEAGDIHAFWRFMGWDRISVWFGYILDINIYVIRHYM